MLSIVKYVIIVVIAIFLGSLLSGVSSADEIREPYKTIIMLLVLAVAVFIMRFLKAIF